MSTRGKRCSTQRTFTGDVSLSSSFLSSSTSLSTVSSSVTEREQFPTSFYRSPCSGESTFFYSKSSKHHHRSKNHSQHHRCHTSSKKSSHRNNPINNLPSSFNICLLRHLADRQVEKAQREIDAFLALVNECSGAEDHHSHPFYCCFSRGCGGQYTSTLPPTTSPMTMKTPSGSDLHTLDQLFSRSPPSSSSPSCPPLSCDAPGAYFSFPPPLSSFSSPVSVLIGPPRWCPSSRNTSDGANTQPKNQNIHKRSNNNSNNKKTKRRKRGGKENKEQEDDAEKETIRQVASELQHFVPHTSATAASSSSSCLSSSPFTSLANSSIPGSSSCSSSPSLLSSFCSYSSYCSSISPYRTTRSFTLSGRKQDERGKRKSHNKWGRETPKNVHKDDSKRKKRRKKGKRDTKGEEDKSIVAEDMNDGYFLVTIRLTRSCLFPSFFFQKANEIHAAPITAPVVEKRNTKVGDSCGKTKRHFILKSHPNHSTIPHYHHHHHHTGGGGGVLSSPSSSYCARWRAILSKCFPCSRVTCYVQARLTSSYLQGFFPYCQWWWSWRRTGRSGRRENNGVQSRQQDVREEEDEEEEEETFHLTATTTTSASSRGSTIRRRNRRRSCGGGGGACDSGDRNGFHHRGGRKEERIFDSRERKKKISGGGGGGGGREKKGGPCKAADRLEDGEGERRWKRRVPLCCSASFQHAGCGGASRGDSFSSSSSSSYSHHAEDEEEDTDDEDYLETYERSQEGKKGKSSVRIATSRRRRQNNNNNINEANRIKKKRKGRGFEKEKESQNGFLSRSTRYSSTLHRMRLKNGGRGGGVGGGLMEGVEDFSITLEDRIYSRGREAGYSPMSTLEGNTTSTPTRSSNNGGDGVGHSRSSSGPDKVGGGENTGVIATAPTTTAGSTREDPQPHMDNSIHHARITSSIPTSPSAPPSSSITANTVAVSTNTVRRLLMRILHGRRERRNIIRKGNEKEGGKWMRGTDKKRWRGTRGKGRDEEEGEVEILKKGRRTDGSLPPSPPLHVDGGDDAHRCTESTRRRRRKRRKAREERVPMPYPHDLLPASSFSSFAEELRQLVQAWIELELDEQDVWGVPKMNSNLPFPPVFSPCPSLGRTSSPAAVPTTTSTTVDKSGHHHRHDHYFPFSSSSEEKHQSRRLRLSVRSPTKASSFSPSPPSPPLPSPSPPRVLSAASLPVSSSCEDSSLSIVSTRPFGAVFLPHGGFLRWGQKKVRPRTEQAQDHRDEDHHHHHYHYHNDEGKREHEVQGGVHHSWHGSHHHHNRTKEERDALHQKDPAHHHLCVKEEDVAVAEDDSFRDHKKSNKPKNFHTNPSIKRQSSSSSSSSQRCSPFSPPPSCVVDGASRKTAAGTAHRFTTPVTTYCSVYFFTTDIFYSRQAPLATPLPSLLWPPVTLLSRRGNGEKGEDVEVAGRPRGRESSWGSASASRSCLMGENNSFEAMGKKEIHTSYRCVRRYFSLFLLALNSSPPRIPPTAPTTTISTSCSASTDRTRLSRQSRRRQARGRMRSSPIPISTLTASAAAAAAAASISWLYHVRLFLGGNITQALRYTATHYCRAFHLWEEEEMVLGIATLADSIALSTASMTKPVPLQTSSSRSSSVEVGKPFSSTEMELILWPALEEMILALQAKGLPFLAGIVLCNVLLPFILREPVGDGSSSCAEDKHLLYSMQQEHYNNSNNNHNKKKNGKKKKKRKEDEEIVQKREGGRGTLSSFSSCGGGGCCCCSCHHHHYQCHPPSPSPFSSSLPPFTHWGACLRAVSFVEHVWQILGRWIHLAVSVGGGAARMDPGRSALSSMMAAALERAMTMEGEARLVRRTLEGEAAALLLGPPPPPSSSHCCGSSRSASEDGDGRDGGGCIDEDDGDILPHRSITATTSPPPPPPPFSSSFPASFCAGPPFSFPPSPLPPLTHCAICRKNILPNPLERVRDKRMGGWFREVEEMGAPPSPTSPIPTTFLTCLRKGSLGLQCVWCGHGGHVDHIMKWWKETRIPQCPEGCGCRCQY